MTIIPLVDERVQMLHGGCKPWWNKETSSMVPSTTVYVPFGCPDWGERGGKRNGLCTFCALPSAAEGFRQAFYGGQVEESEYLRLFRETFELALKIQPECHTLMIFNAGSFPAMSPTLQTAIVNAVAKSNILRLVIESRAELVQPRLLETLTSILRPSGKQLTIRVGIETQDDYLRLKVLKKGHSRTQLQTAQRFMQEHGVVSGGYIMLNPAPRLSPDQAMEEGIKTVDWVLGELGFDECYFCSTNVGPNTPLTKAWERGEFAPASLWMVLKVLLQAVEKYGKRVHLLSFKDEPELLAVPSNHVAAGIPQNLQGAAGCDGQFHAMLECFRQTMDRNVLIPPDCNCKPGWF